MKRKGNPVIATKIVTTPKGVLYVDASPDSGRTILGLAQVNHPQKTSSPNYYIILDINECQLGNHDCADGQRCDNIPGSYQCSRIAGCGTGYTLNSLSGLCEDDDECQLGMHNCNDLGPKFQCRNTLGSYRCEKIHTPLQSVTRFVPVTPAEPTYSLPNYPVISGLLKRCLPGYKMNADGVCEGTQICLNYVIVFSKYCRYKRM